MNTTQHRRCWPASPRRDGFIVLVVMIVIVMITLAGLSFVLTLSTENKAVHRQGDQLQLDEALASGMELLKAFCSQSAQLREESGGTQDNAAVFGNLVMPGDGGARDVLQLSIISPAFDGQAGDVVRFGLQNESARLNLGVLADWERRVPGSAAAALLQLPGMSESTAAAILDWLDADGQPRPGGAEAEYYAGLGLPYEPRNGVPALLEELLLVRDVSRQALFGADANFDFQVDAGESQAAAANPTGSSEDSLPWARLMTVTGAERNLTFAGKPRIHLNERDLKRLHAQLTETLDQPWADFVIAYRQFGPSADSTASPPAKEARRMRAPQNRNRSRKLRSSQGQAAESPLDLSAPARFEIECVLDLVGVTVMLPTEAAGGAAEAAGETAATAEETDGAAGATAAAERWLACPLKEDSPELREQLPRLADLTTTTDQAVIPGRVNLNEAPRCVLLGVPGLDPGTVDRILALRSTIADDSDLARRHALWLWTEGLVDRTAMRALWPYVTGGGDVFRAQLVAQRQGTGRTARAEAVVDATQSPPRQVYWRNLTLWGGTFSKESLGLDASVDSVPPARRGSAAGTSREDP
ncbi:MAG: general secretion pathway protein GspK [Pirellulaceae bacterium]|nr:general secretion pathway protein GspK [Pirellulaceae bacterium]